MMDWLKRLLVPFIRWAGTVHAPWAVKLCDSDDYERIKELIRPGDILVTRSLGHFSNLLIPGYWKHVGIMGPHGLVIEAVGNGVVDTELTDFVFTKDEIAVLRPTFCDEGTSKNAAEYAEVCLGSNYDYEFSLGNKSFYCAELAYVSYNTPLESTLAFGPRERLGVNTVTADDFFEAKKFWRTIYDSRSPDG